MSSTTSTPRTPPDPFIDDPAKVAFIVPTSDTYNESPAVGELCKGVGKEGFHSAFESAREASQNERKDTALDPLLLEAALASGPHVSRHHYHHSFFPSAEDVCAYSWEWSDGQRVLSHQAPRNVRLGSQSDSSSFGNYSSRSSSASPDLEPSDALAEDACFSPPTVSRASSAAPSDVFSSSSELSSIETNGISTHAIAQSTLTAGDVQVRCMVRTRVPTPHGEVFLHLYHNNRDNKEHLAVIVDPAQLDLRNDAPQHASYIRSKSLDSVWHDEETPMDRITRGAYVGRLGKTGSTHSGPSASDGKPSTLSIPAPLVRIHSECFTGETIGSMRCDCGEQLDEAIRRIFQPITANDPMTGEQVIIPGRGAVIYMRQEGRGIGLLSKLRAYNLQDLGHDTVQANLLLGHDADERGYEVAAAILHDLGLGSVDGRSGESIRLLTNNPDKVEKLERAGVCISEQVSMVPRLWRCQVEDTTQKDGTNNHASSSDDNSACLRSAGATMIGAGASHGAELEKYLRTKVLRMGHMLSLPPSVA